MTTEELILKLVDERGYISKDDIRSYCYVQLRRDSATADRKARLVAQAGKIFPHYEGGVLKGYKKYKTSETLIINTLKEKIQNPLFKITPTPF